MLINFIVESEKPFVNICYLIFIIYIVPNGESTPFGTFSYIQNIYSERNDLMSDNWVIQNLENTLPTWNEKLTEI